MLAHQLGFPLPIAVTSGIWNWEKLWREGGAPGSPYYDTSHPLGSRKRKEIRKCPVCARISRAYQDQD